MLHSTPQEDSFGAISYQFCSTFVFFKLIRWFSKHDSWENREKPHTNKIVAQESNEGSNKSNQTSQKKNRVTKHSQSLSYEVEGPVIV